jgi:hypothetical protein
MPRCAQYLAQETLVTGNLRALRTIFTKAFTKRLRGASAPKRFRTSATKWSFGLFSAVVFEAVCIGTIVVYSQRICR